MRHRTSVIRFKGGIDASRMMMRRLVVDFVKHGRIVTTENRVKTMRQHIEKLVTLAKAANSSGKNKLLAAIGNDEVVSRLITIAQSESGKSNGGYLKMKRLLPRQSDASPMMSLEWVHAYVEKKEQQVKPSKKKVTKKVEKTELAQKE